MTLASLWLQIRRYEYSVYLNIVKFVEICTLPLYVINMNVMSLFANSSFFIYNDFEFIFIDVLYQFVWTNTVYFCQKANKKNLMLLTFIVQLCWLHGQLINDATIFIKSLALIPIQVWCVALYQIFPCTTVIVGLP
jgi:hypothetical protein